MKINELIKEIENDIKILVTDGEITPISGVMQTLTFIIEQLKIINSDIAKNVIENDYDFIKFEK